MTPAHARRRSRRHQHTRRVADTVVRLAEQRRPSRGHFGAHGLLAQVTHYNGSAYDRYLDFADDRMVRRLARTVTVDMPGVPL